MSSEKSRIPRKLKKKIIFDRYEDGSVAILGLKNRKTNGKIKNKRIRG